MGREVWTTQFETVSFYSFSTVWHFYYRSYFLFILLPTYLPDFYFTWPWIFCRLSPGSFPVSPNRFVLPVWRNVALAFSARTFLKALQFRRSRHADARKANWERIIHIWNQWSRQNAKITRAPDMFHLVSKASISELNQDNLGRSPKHTAIEYPILTARRRWIRCEFSLDHVYTEYFCRNRWNFFNQNEQISFQ